MSPLKRFSRNRTARRREKRYNSYKSIVTRIKGSLKSRDSHPILVNDVFSQDIDDGSLVKKNHGAVPKAYSPFLCVTFHGLFANSLWFYQSHRLFFKDCSCSALLQEGKLLRFKLAFKVNVIPFAKTAVPFSLMHMCSLLGQVLG